MNSAWSRFQTGQNLPIVRFGSAVATGRSLCPVEAGQVGLAAVPGGLDDGAPEATVLFQETGRSPASYSAPSQG